MKKRKQMLMVIVGYSGAGKTTVAKEFGAKYDLVMLNEDDFVFKMNPASMIKRVARENDRVLGMENLMLVLEHSLKTGKSVVIEGALVDGPVYLRDFKDVAKRYNCVCVPVMLMAERKVRVNRKKAKNGHVISARLDKRLRGEAKKLQYHKACKVVDTTDLTLKGTLVALERIWAELEGIYNALL